MRLLPTLAALLLASALRAEPSEEDRAEMATLLDTLETALARGEIDALFNLMPPAILSEIAQQADMTVDEVLVRARSARTEDVSEFELLADDDRAYHGETDDDRAFALIPAAFVFTENGETKEENVLLLLVETGSDWRIVEVSDGYLRNLAQTQLAGFGSVDLDALAGELQEADQ